MKCPRCESTTMDEREREGVVVDACPACRGVWLDRGELEKLISRATKDIEEYGRSAPSYDSRRPRHDDDDHYRRKHHPPTWARTLKDIFD